MYIAKSALFITVFTLIQFSPLLAQKNLTGKIVEKSTNKPLRYVNIYNKNNNSGTYSNVHGFFTISIDSPTDTIVFTSIGYESKEIIWGKESNTTIHLNKKSYEIEETLVSAEKRKYKSKAIGYKPEKKSSVLIYSGYEIGSFISNPISKETRIETINFSISELEHPRAILKIHLYYPDSITGKPQEQIPLNKEYFEVNKPGVFSIDLSDSPIFMPIKGIFVSIEWVGFMDQNGNLITENTLLNGIKFNFKSNKCQTYIKPRGLDWLSIQSPFSKQPNLAITLDLKYTK